MQKIKQLLKKNATMRDRLNAKIDNAISSKIKWLMSFIAQKHTIGLLGRVYVRNGGFSSRVFDADKSNCTLGGYVCLLVRPSISQSIKTTK